MSFQPGYVSRILAGSLSMSAKANSVKITNPIEMHDTTTFADDGHKTFTPGMDASTLDVVGFYDLATDTELTAWKSSDEVITFFEFGDTVGNGCVILDAQRATFTPNAKVNDVVAFDLDAQADGATDFGISLHALGAETATANGTTQDNSASTANGAAASLHVTAYSGFTNIVVTVAHSTDNFAANDVDLITFSTVTGTTSEIKTVTGTVNRYVRVYWTKSGTGSATFAVGFARR